MKDCTVDRVCRLRPKHRPENDPVSMGIAKSHVNCTHMKPDSYWQGCVFETRRANDIDVQTIFRLQLSIRISLVKVSSQSLHNLGNCPSDWPYTVTDALRRQCVGLKCSGECGV
jgi:hypothetical protein